MKKSELTLDILFQKVFEKHWDTARFNASGHAKEVARLYSSKIHPSFGEKPAAEITRHHVRDWHESMKHTPIEANRALVILSATYQKALELEFIETQNPCIFVKHFTEKRRNRYASDVEIGKLFASLMGLKEEEPLAAVLLLTVLFTGARPQSLWKLSWDNLRGGRITFHGKGSSKNGEPEVLIVSKEIVDMWRSLTKRSDSLIFGKVMYQPLWEKVSAEAGCPDLWARDLRRTFATVGMSSGIKMDTISELLNHKSVQTTKLYAKLNDDARVEASSAISNKISEIVKRSST